MGIEDRVGWVGDAMELEKSIAVLLGANVEKGVCGFEVSSCVVSGFVLACDSLTESHLPETVQATRG